MFKIDNIDEVYALQKGLMELRFYGLDVDWAIQGSPLLGRLHERTVETIIAYHETLGEIKKADGWREWRRFNGRGIEPPSIRSYLTKIWPSLSSAEEKREAVINQMRPFTFTEAEVKQLIEDVEAQVNSSK